MPRIDISAVPTHRGSGYPAELAAPCADRLRQRLGEAGGLGDFGVNLTRLPPGSWSSQRHWHTHEDEFVFVLDGELVLVEDEGETVLRAGDCAAFPKNSGNGHHLVNRSSATPPTSKLEAAPPMMSSTAATLTCGSASSDGRFTRRDGTPYAPTDKT